MNIVQKYTNTMKTALSTYRPSREARRAAIPESWPGSRRKSIRTRLSAVPAVDNLPETEKTDLR